jgi:hypothetical protein
MNKNYFPDEFYLDLQAFLRSPSSHEPNVLTSHDFDPKDPLNRLKSVKLNNKQDFCIFLSLLILTDQILYTYDKENYKEFKEKHNIPKLEFCGHGRVNSYPFSIFSYIKVSEELFTFNMNSFFNLFILINLNTSQQQIFLMAIEEDKDLKRDTFGELARSIFGKYKI